MKKSDRQTNRRPTEKKSKIHRYSVNLDDGENEKFLSLLRQTESKNISRFIADVLLNREIKVVKIDKVAKDYYIMLTNIYSQYRAIGVNYNQTVKAIKTNFAEKRALSLLYKLEKATIELIAVTRKIADLTKNFEEKWLQK